MSDKTPIAAETAPETADTASELPSEPPSLETRILDAIKTVYDPEIPVNIYELGLIYDVDIAADDKVHVKMTLTAPGCPVAGTLPLEVEAKVRGVHGVADASVEVVWEPAWCPDLMSEAAKLELGFF